MDTFLWVVFWLQVATAVGHILCLAVVEYPVKRVDVERWHHALRVACSITLSVGIWWMLHAYTVTPIAP